MITDEKRSFLIVEDESELCTIMGEGLRDAGFTSVTASNLREASLKLKNQKFSCILLDIRLGAEDGSELIQWVRTRKDLQNQHTPIILISGHLSPDKLRKASGKVQAALVKPFTVEQLLACARKTFGQAA